MESLSCHTIYIKDATNRYFQQGQQAMLSTAKAKAWACWKAVQMKQTHSAAKAYNSCFLSHSLVAVRHLPKCRTQRTACKSHIQGWRWSLSTATSEIDPVLTRGTAPSFHSSCKCKQIPRLWFWMVAEILSKNNRRSHWLSWLGSEGVLGLLCSHRTVQNSLQRSEAGSVLFQLWRERQENKFEQIPVTPKQLPRDFRSYLPLLLLPALVKQQS